MHRRRRTVRKQYTAAYQRLVNVTQKSGEKLRPPIEKKKEFHNSRPYVAYKWK